MIRRFIETIAEKKYAVRIALLAFCLSQAFVLYLLGPAEKGLIGLQLTATPDHAYAIMESWGTKEWDGFWAHYRWDFVHPFVYSVALAIALAHVKSQSRSIKPWLLYVPFLVAAFDILENIMHINAGLSYPNKINALFVIGGLAAMTKWFLAAFAILVGSKQWLKHLTRT